MSLASELREGDMTTAEAFDRATVAIRNLLAAWERAQAQIAEERWRTHFANPANLNQDDAPASRSEET